MYAFDGEVFEVTYAHISHPNDQILCTNSTIQYKQYFYYAFVFVSGESINKLELELELELIYLT